MVVYELEGYIRMSRDLTPIGRDPMIIGYFKNDCSDIEFNELFCVEGLPRNWDGSAIKVRLIREEILKHTDTCLAIKEIYGVVGVSVPLIKLDI